MIADDKLKEVMTFYTTHGSEETIASFGFNEATLARYKTLYKKKFGALDETLIKLKAVYSQQELDTLIKSKETFHPKKRDTIHSFDGEEFSLLLISDSHIGSKYTHDNHIIEAIEEGNRQKVDMLLHPGDVVEGMSGRDGHVYELTHIGYKAQRQAAIEIFKRFDGPIKMISGNHDLWYSGKANMGGLIVEDICQSLPEAEYLGEHEGTIDINGAKIVLWHGEDGATYATSYRAQKIIEALEGGEKPSMLITAHDHKQGYFFQRNVHSILAGCLQRQSGWMRRKRLAAYCGFWIVKTKIKDASMVYVEPRWYPFYK